MQTGVIVTLMHELQLVPDIGNIIPIMRVPYAATTNDYACARGCLLGVINRRTIQVAGAAKLPQ